MEEWSTAQVKLPTNPIELVIGQDEAVRVASLVARQRRNLLLVGPPGTGKSMIAQAIASLIPKPTQEIYIVHDPEKPERPFVEVLHQDQIKNQKESSEQIGRLVPPSAVPVFVSERLGFRCKHCGNLSNCSLSTCPSCGYEKYMDETSLFDDLMATLEIQSQGPSRVQATQYAGGQEQIVFYERGRGNMVKLLTQKDMRKLAAIEQKKLRKVLVPLKRNTFIQATGASETELLGDVKHDPYGGHPEVGQLPYTRVVPGAVHEAHEGVLYIDELSTLGALQRYLLTAMQEKKFAITGRNASSTGASVKVENVPCDFIFVTAVNINDMGSIMPPLRSRIVGNGYELLVATHMPANEANKQRLFQFIAQEIKKDGHIPQADLEACEALAAEAARRAKIEGHSNAYTLRLRSLSGIIRMSGDVASTEGSPMIRQPHVKSAISRSKTIEEQIGESFDGSWWKAGMSDYGGQSGSGKKKGENEIA